MNHGYRRPALNRGVGLIEVLIAVLIFAVGMLGIAAMQATSLRNSQSAIERSQAVTVTYAILDAMRANRVQALNGLYNTPGPMCIAPMPSGGDPLWKTDQIQWITSLKDALGLADTTCGTITCAAPIPGSSQIVCTIDVAWDDSRGLSGSTSETFTTVASI